MKYLLHLSYKGTAYRGWQRQLDAVSVQQTIEDLIMRVVKEKMFIVGCGRTDAGVHATNYVAHMEVTEELRPDFHFIINKLLPNDIVIHSVEAVDDHVQAQFHVQHRRYDYYLHTHSQPLLNSMSTLVDDVDYDIATMKSAIAMLVGVHDFRYFCKQADKHESTICDLLQAQLYVADGRYQVRLTANRFLRSMVRLIVGNLFLVGSGHLSIADWYAAIECQQPFSDFNIARPEGLQLSGLQYPKRGYMNENFLSLRGIADS